MCRATEADTGGTRSRDWERSAMPFINPRRLSALLWGLVGALSFLVAHGGYLLLGGAFLGVGPVAAVTSSSSWRRQ